MAAGGVCREHLSPPDLNPDFAPYVPRQAALPDGSRFFVCSMFALDSWIGSEVVGEVICTWDEPG